jgi:hypothetical protein
VTKATTIAAATHPIETTVKTFAAPAAKTTPETATTGAAKAVTMAVSSVRASALSATVKKHASHLRSPLLYIVYNSIYRNCKSIKSGICHFR